MPSLTQCLVHFRLFLSTNCAFLTQRKCVLQALLISVIFSRLIMYIKELRASEWLEASAFFMYHGYKVVKQVQLTNSARCQNFVGFDFL